MQTSVDKGHDGDELFVADLLVPIHVSHVDHLPHLLFRELLALLACLCLLQR